MLCQWDMFAKRDSFQRLDSIWLSGKIAFWHPGFYADKNSFKMRSEGKRSKETGLMSKSIKKKNW